MEILLLYIVFVLFLKFLKSGVWLIIPLFPFLPFWSAYTIRREKPALAITLITIWSTLYLLLLFILLII